MPLPDDKAAYKQHAVPQNIMDVEFKLIGDLTMRQFIYLLVFGVIAYIIYITVFGLFKWPLVLFFVLLGLGLAFVPIQERGMDEWFVNFFRSVYSPTQMVWQKEPILPSAFTYDSLALVRQELITLAPTSSRRKLEEYLEMQHDKEEVDLLDIPEREYIMKVRQAYAPVATEVDLSAGAGAQDVIPQYEKEVSPGVVQTAQPAQLTPPSQTTQQDHTEEGPTMMEDAPEARSLIEETKKKEAEQKMGFSDFVKSRLSAGAKKKQTEEPGADMQKKADGKPQIEEKPKQEQVVKKPLPQLPKLPTSMTDNLLLSPLTPDRHIGRRFTHMTSKEGQLILPVRGEKIIQTSEEIDIQRDIDEKASQLNKLLDQIKGDKKIAAEIKPKEEKDDKQDERPMMPKKEEKQEVTQAKDVVKEVKKENERLSNEIHRLKKSIEKGKSLESDEELKKKEEQLKKLEEEKTKKGADYTSLQRQLHELQQRLKEKEDPTAALESAQPTQPTYAKMQALTNDPNVVSGVVKKENNEALPNIVLLIKNNKGEPVRGIKTNSLGQFSLSTPLVNGLYTLEVDPNASDGFTFDIITVEVKGEVLPPIELVGRPV